MKDYISFTIRLDGADKDQLLAKLDLAGYDMILEEDNQLTIYSREDQLKFESVNALAIYINIPPDLISSTRHEDENWNETWEKNFEPVVVEDQILIRAEFHDEDPSFEYSICISPKMAFGTGHHETTYMMLQQMLALDFDGKKVLDYGCGTGILSVFAIMKGTINLYAIDIDPLSTENTKEHLFLNNCSEEHYTIREGDLNELSNDFSFDIILANINRSVLERQVEYLGTMLNEEGKLLISGILKRDFQLISDLYHDHGYKLIQKIDKGEWSCALLDKTISQG